MGVVERIKYEIAENILSNIKHFYSVEDEIPNLLVRLSTNEQFGDFTTTAALQMKSRVKEPLQIIGEKIAGSLQISSAEIKSVEVTPSGYINIYLNPSWQIQVIKGLIETKTYGKTIEIPTGHIFEEAKYIIERVDNILDALEKEGFVPHYDALSWKDISNNEERDLVRFFILAAEKMDTFNAKDTHMLLEELIKGFYGYHNKLQLRKLNEQQLNIVLIFLICYKNLLTTLLPIFLTSSKKLV